MSLRFNGRISIGGSPPPIGSRITNSIRMRNHAGKSQKEADTSLGCRFQFQGSGCRCGKVTEGNSAFCEDHMGGTPKEILGLTDSSFVRRNHR